MAMGTKMGPSYANLFVSYMEHQYFNQYNNPNPELYRRYIDDCIGATSSSREDLNQFITAVNLFHPALICCIHLNIHHMSRIPFLILSFLDIFVFVVKTLIFNSIRGNVQFL